VTRSVYGPVVGERDHRSRTSRVSNMFVVTFSRRGALEVGDW